MEKERKEKEIEKKAQNKHASTEASQDQTPPRHENKGGASGQEWPSAQEGVGNFLHCILPG